MSYLDDLVHRICALGHPREQAIAELAFRQHGVVARWQLLVLGLSSRQIQHRVTTGHAHRIHVGVYAVGHRCITLKGRWIAAVLACGPEAVLSHRAAAALWDLRPIPSGPIDVTAPARGRKGRRGIRVHSVRKLHVDDRDVVDGIPVTSVHRTLLDFAEIARKQQVRLAIEAADRQDLLDQRKLEQLCKRNHGRHGLMELKALMGEINGPAPWTQSEIERRFLAMIREDGLPEPQTNVIVEGYPVDMWWPAQRLVVELDGFKYHKTRERFEFDRLKDTKLQLANCRVLRATQRRMDPDPSELRADVRRALTAG